MCPATTKPVHKALERVSREDLAQRQQGLKLNIYEVLEHGFPSPPDCLAHNFKALPKAARGTESDFQSMYALDCEMVNTVHPDTRKLFSELARVSVVDVSCDVVFDLLVKPQYEIIDYLTPYSGLTAEIMKDATHTLEDIHQVFSEKFDASTIFVGHSLEQDLTALKFVHLNVIDTRYIFK